MIDEHASMAASTLVACSQRSFAVSIAFADRLRASNKPAAIWRHNTRAKRRHTTNKYVSDMVASFRFEDQNATLAQSADETLVDTTLATGQASQRPQAPGS